MTVEQFLHDPAHLLRIDMAIDMDHPALAGVLVKDGQHFEIPTVIMHLINDIRIYKLKKCGNYFSVLLGKFCGNACKPGYYLQQLQELSS